MNTKAKGSRAERRAMRLLEAAGYTVTKAGGSLGLFDLIAISSAGVRCVQVKSGTARLSGVEREAITAFQVPANVTREYWRFPDFARQPIIEWL
jgi:Holliday junction resolvase